MAISLLSLGLNEKERSPRCARDDRFFYISTLPTKRTTCFVIANPRAMTTTRLGIRKGGVAISLLLLSLNEKERSPRCARDDRPFVIANPRSLTTTSLGIRKGGVAISFFAVIITTQPNCSSRVTHNHFYYSG